MMFDRRGQILDEFDAPFQRSWGINMVGECKFTLPVRDTKNTEANFQFGNHIVVMNDDGLPPWCGRMTTPRVWGNKTTKHKAISSESIFADRIGPYTKPYGIIGEAGRNFLTILQIANDAEDTLIRTGDVYRGGSNTGTLISPAVLLSDNIGQILKQSGCEYEVVPQVVNNRLTLYLNLYAEMGTDTGVALNDANCRIEENSLSENGPIKNLLLGIGQEQEIQNHYLATNKASRDTYGLMAAPYEVNAVEAPAVEALTLQQLAELRRPRKTFRATASQVNNLFRSLRNGNRLWYENVENGYGARGIVGTQAQVRLFGMAYSDSVDGVALTIGIY